MIKGMHDGMVTTVSTTGERFIHSPPLHVYVKSTLGP